MENRAIYTGDILKHEGKKCIALETNISGSTVTIGYCDMSKSLKVEKSLLSELSAKEKRIEFLMGTLSIPESLNGLNNQDRDKMIIELAGLLSEDNET